MSLSRGPAPFIRAFEISEEIGEHVLHPAHHLSVRQTVLLPDHSNSPNHCPFMWFEVLECHRLTGGFLSFSDEPLNVHVVSHTPSFAVNKTTLAVLITPFLRQSIFQTVQKLVRHPNYFPRGFGNRNFYGVGRGQCPYWCPCIARHERTQRDRNFLTH